MLKLMTWIEAHPHTANFLAPWCGIFLFLVGLYIYWFAQDIAEQYWQRRWESYGQFRWYEGWTYGSRERVSNRQANPATRRKVQSRAY